MKSRTCYTIGYSQKHADMTLQQLIEWGVMLIDIRLKPYSRWKPRYNKNALIARYGDYDKTITGRYVHIEDLGNTAYLDKLGYISLKRPDAGIPLVLSFLETYDVVLLCVCKQWSTCHRHKITELLLEQTHTLRVIHIDEEHNVRSTWDAGYVINQWTRESLIEET